MKPPNQLVNPTAELYLDTIQNLILMLRNVPVDRWEPGDISYLHEVDSLLSDVLCHFEGLDDAPNPDDYEPES
jgi:hypothetical protein